MPYNLTRFFSNHKSESSLPRDKPASAKKLKQHKSTPALTQYANGNAIVATPLSERSSSSLRTRSHTFTARDINNTSRPNTIYRSSSTTYTTNTLGRTQKQSFGGFARNLVSVRRHRRGSLDSIFIRSSSIRSDSSRTFRNSPLAKSSTPTRHPPYSPAMTRQAGNGVAYKQLTSTRSDASDSAESRDEDTQPASVEYLVRKCSNCFDQNGKCSNDYFPSILFITHRWFMTSEQLMILFSQLYEEEKTSPEFKKKIFFAIRFWLHEFPHMFDMDVDLNSALQSLQRAGSTDPDVDTSVIDLNNRASYSWMSEKNLSMRPTQVNRKRRKVSLVFNHLEPEEIAIHMSYLEYKSFRRLTLLDFHNYAVHGVIKNNLKLERVVFLFNNITHWVQCMILDHHKPPERAQAIVKFVEVAKKLYAMRNFNTLMAIVGALTHTAIGRLKKTMAVVPKDTLKTLDEFIELLDSKSNYCCYRRAYYHIAEFKIPIIGILMKDLIALHAALPDRVGDGMINVRKMMMIGGIFQELIGLQQTGFPFDVNHDLVNTLRVSLYLYYNEEEIYQLSIAREPRDVKYSTSGMASPAKLINMGFAEFASFTCQLDDDTIKQHVTAMVTSVFKTYDENADGYISEVEFENFIQNFPGLDSFATVDKDQDGKISRNEMVDYFLKISSSRRNQVCQSFKHSFVETTYFHPTFCEECEKLLWGLVKQGWKCKDCGINCHKHCKDRIVQECRPKSTSRNGNHPSPVAKKGDKRRDKASISSESDFSMNGDIAKTTLDDEAFDHSDSKHPIISHSKKRPPSYGEDDVTTSKSNSHQGKHRSKMKSKTPPSNRKSSPTNINYDTGKKTLSHLMQNMMPKKKNAEKLLSQDPKTTPGTPSTPGTPGPLSSFLYPRSPGGSTFETTRQDSSSEDADSGMEQGSTIPVRRKQIITEYKSTVDQQTKQNVSTSFVAEQCTTERRDSGLSSCSCATAPSISTSSPATPMSQDVNSGDCSFLYPANSSGLCSTSPKLVSETGLPQHSTNDISQKSLKDENERLRHENEELKRKLDNAHNVIRKLEAKLCQSNIKT